MPTPQLLTARAEGGTHDGEDFDITSRREAVTLEYYELVLYTRGNLLKFVREYDRAERHLAFDGTEAFGVARPSLDSPDAARPGT
jgi:hypothetical protein